jgi:adenine-specific DNA-methyltransferase
VTKPGEEIAKFDLQSQDILDSRRQELLRLFPEVHTESGGINFDALRSSLGDLVHVGAEGFGMSWPGKAECLRVIQRQSIATLLPAVDESINWDTTQNVIIEGDNLEVLKVLQKAYLGKVKMIYIDPPYNTGSDFIYPDNYTESLKTYLQYTGQIDDEGRKFSTNTESSGRFHSKWLNMMYPRLSLARELLTDDGVIFVSIDDHEVGQLRASLNEIYGESNFLGQFVWVTKNAARGVPPKTMLMSNHEYVLAYARNIEKVRFLGIERDESDFANPDNDPRGLWRSESMKATGAQDNFFEIVNPQNGDKYFANWAFSADSIKRMIAENLVIFPTSKSGTPRQKKFMNSYLNDRKAFVTNLGWFSTENATKAMMDLFDGKKVFDFPKPVDLIKFFVEQTTKDELVLDFFAGSGTLAQAVLEQNELDNGRRHFVMVQLPEVISENSEAQSFGFTTIAELTRERVRRVGLQIESKSTIFTNEKRDIGFRSFKLDQSNFAVWDAGAIEGDEKRLEQQLFAQVEHVLPGRSNQDVLFELMLKSRYQLTTPVELAMIESCEVWKIADSEMVVVIDSGLTVEVIREIASWKPISVVILDRCFVGDDSLKANARKIFEDAKVDLKTV